ncbi:putative wall-associated receptor kinase, galacturonan-binding domain-containing protein [Helianthus annuus]|nr:putative wall-associated receptor kinase, galacturonan-binding domain-containing protein [Helianthus annuus]KAJ0637542.1 putative wall-associated receptor kinase, galacturonan-binding domain-containing protein [Helianthus annuus]
MESYKHVFSLLYIISLLSSAASNDCTTSYCGQSINGVRFPFRLTDQQPKNCGFAGFDLRCAFPSMLLINIPGSGEFSVRSIDYRYQSIRIYDPLNCLPARLLTFNLSNSPFSALYFQTLTLLSCPSNVTASLAFKHIVCLSNSSFSTFAADSNTDLTSMNGGSGCRITGQLRVPVDQPYSYWYRSPLDDEDITLTWGKPDCKICERVGRSCGYENSNTQRTKCYSSRDGKI